MSDDFSGAGAAAVSGGDVGSGGSGGGSMPAGDMGGGAPSSLPSGGESRPYSQPGDWDDQNLLNLSRQIFGTEGREDVLAKQQQQQQQNPNAPAQPEERGIPMMRQQISNLERDLNSWKEFGDIEDVRTGLSMLGAAFSENPTDFWAQMHQASPDHVISILDSAIAAWPDFFVDAMVRAGYVSPGDLTDQTEIRPEFRSLYQSLPQGVRAEMAALDPESRDYKLHEMHHQQQVHNHLVQQEQQRQAEAQQKLATDVRTAALEGIKAQLGDKLKPTGTELDGMLSDVAVSWAEFQVTSDPKYAAIMANLNTAIENREMRKAMSLIPVLQTAAAQKISGFLEKLAPVFSNHHNYLRQGRERGAGLINPGAGAGQDGGKGLPPGAGEWTDENLIRMSREIFG